jgi:hypothetical protein
LFSARYQASTGVVVDDIDEDHPHSLTRQAIQRHIEQPASESDMMSVTNLFCAS